MYKQNAQKKKRNIIVLVNGKWRVFFSVQKVNGQNYRMQKPQ